MNYDLIGTGTAAMCAPSGRRTAGWRRRSAPYRLILMDCDDAMRTHRLVVERKQPELANSVMPSWVRFLRDDACEYF